MTRRRYEDDELMDMALRFYKENGRPPTMRELRPWRTIVRRWKDKGAWKGFLEDVGLPTFEEWERQERINAMREVLNNYGEIPYGKYVQIFEDGTYPNLPEPSAVWRMLGTKEFGKGGKVWEIIRNS